MSYRRIERCYTDNIYLIESFPPEEDNPYERNYLIMGNSGNTYTVTISNEPSCTCPDFITRGNRCKYIFFVLIRIMNVDDYEEEEYSDYELEQMFLNIPEVAKNLMYNGENPIEQKEVNQKFEKDDICPICLDPLENGKELDYCKYSCGKTIHKKCFTMWEKSKGGICVFCRGKWYSNYPSNPKKVSMHPIDPIQIEEESVRDNNNNNYEINNNYEKIDIENENDDDDNMEIISQDKIKKRNMKRSRSKSKSRSRSMSRNISRSRSRDKSKSNSRNVSRSRSRNRSRKRKKNKIKYPKD